MAFLRIAVFEDENAPADTVQIWDDLVGSALRNNPDCSHVMLSHRGSNFAVVSKWSSEDRFRYWMDSGSY